MMVDFSCPFVCTNQDKSWLYDEYYVGERDDEKRKNGQGRNHWIGAKSIEWYTGPLLRDTMHGLGDYRWRYLGEDGTHFTYEGNFYCNKMHGYGTMSYPDGRIFTGLFHSNFRWGPGVQSHADLREDVGLWRGQQLIRMIWRPATPSVALDLYASNVGKACVDSHRVLLTETYKKIGETNSAIDLLKQHGADPRIAAEKWSKLYPKHCTDLKSPLCFVEAFEYGYHNGTIHMLEEVSCVPEIIKDTSQTSLESRPNLMTYYAWNNNRVAIHMMQHTYMHDMQRDPVQLNLGEVLSGPRKQFKHAGKHEISCRSLLMASYLGHIPTVVELINDVLIHPDISDSLGNSAVMYAACGDQAKIVHFLVEAGANVDSYNDSCCTPLGLALLRYTCALMDIGASGMMQAVLPPPVVPAPPPVEQRVFEWNFTRDQAVSLIAGLARAPSKMTKLGSTATTKRIKSSHSLKDLSSTGVKKKTETDGLLKPAISERFSEESLPEDMKVYSNLNTEFEAKINDIFLQPSGPNLMTRYIFDIRDMVKDADVIDAEQSKLPDKTPKKNLSKQLKDTMKPSKEMMWQGTDKEEIGSINSVEKLKRETLNRITTTILQLLSDGADPNLVICPQPALFIAIVSGNPDLVKHLVNSGANINECYKETFGYTPLDIALSRDFSFETLELVRAVLECGAITCHRLRYGDASPADSIIEENGPTLLHAVLARKSENEADDDIKQSILELLLEYNCNPLVQFKGRSAVDVAMTKSMDIFDIFIRSPATYLNASINDLNQTALVKMFSLPFFRTVNSTERLQTLTNLLLFGADPLIECTDGTEKYTNIFVFTHKTLGELEAAIKTSAPSPMKTDSKKATPPPKKESLSTKSIGKLDEIGDYRQSIDLVTECARLLHVRWLQAKLMKELLVVIDKYKHRPWNMILKEHKHKKSTGLWLTTQRCLEIWDTLKLTRRKIYNDDKILKHLLYIVQYYNRLNKIVPSSHPTAQQKTSIECNINYLLKERNAAAKLSHQDLTSWKKPYVKPELISKADEHKFNICFECALPFTEERIECVSCKLVAFCSWYCMQQNIEHANCHPCSMYLKEKYFPSPESSIDVVSSV